MRVEGTRLVYSINLGSSARTNVHANDLTQPLRRRMNDAFGSGVEVNAIGSTDLEVLVPTTDPIKIKIAKDLIDSSGVLRFLIVANRFDHMPIFLLAKAETGASHRDVQDAQGQVVARWVTIGRESELTGVAKPLRATGGYNGLYRDAASGDVLDLPETLFAHESETKIVDWMHQQGISDLDLLTVVDSDFAIGGEDLAFAAMTLDESGGPAIAFNLTDAASARFFKLTTLNAPKGLRQVQLGIILDDELLTAPNINSPIRKEGRITGNFTREEVDRIVQLLKSGQLPADLKKTPLSESQVEMKRSIFHHLFQ